MARTAICDTCKQEVTAYTVTFNPNATEAKTECKSCANGDAVHNPSDMKLWSGPQFDPNGYEMKDGVRVLKPEREAEIIKELSSGGLEQEEEAARQRRMANRRQLKRPALKQSEIEMIDRMVRHKIKVETQQELNDETSLIVRP